ncbi:hypothetical protein M409DRAFT_23602 [Zasmidium cellare ATCC 36951]|uniref:FAD-binding domain-containing protein n=1 Tax=Zasmidium cellare ATCC 36951 TaxID=1080233 RepID=A0A6A6CI58_ZASCE|nr:uncharacterized protein M409DRAFT_23602 [Zasmidium cellare ATCC 36951]KAF2165870.1 hypothetical protein M409DRAFT_23602 [Zasmidium cellare ATCC 36951]
MDIPGQQNNPKDSVLVVGAGMGGCATALGLARRGHNVHVLEARDDLSELGAGLQISPNASRVLCTWGLRDKFEEKVCVPPWLEYRAYDNGRTLGKLPNNVNDWYEDIYGAPLWTIYRPDYQRILAEAAMSSGAKFTFSAKVEKVDSETGAVELRYGREFRGDLVVGADGVWSKVRSGIPGCQNVEPVV